MYNPETTARFIELRKRIANLEGEDQEKLIQEVAEFTNTSPLVYSLAMWGRISSGDSSFMLKIHPLICKTLRNHAASPESAVFFSETQKQILKEYGLDVQP
jgi:hypothetical protein